MRWRRAGRQKHKISIKFDETSIALTWACRKGDMMRRLASVHLMSKGRQGKKQKGFRGMRSKYLNKFILSDSGTATLDWVLLTATLVGLGVSVIAYVSTGTLDLAEKIEQGTTAPE